LFPDTWLIEYSISHYGSLGCRHRLSFLWPFQYPQLPSDNWQQCVQPSTKQHKGLEWVPGPLA